MLYAYENFNEFDENYKYWANTVSFAFTSKEMISFSDSDSPALVEHNGKKYLAIEKDYLLEDEKDVKYFFNDAQFYSDAFPKIDIVCAPIALPESFEPNRAFIALLIPIDTRRKDVLSGVNWFNIIHTPG